MYYKAFCSLRNISNMRGQMSSLGLHFDWDRVSALAPLSSLSYYTYDTPPASPLPPSSLPPSSLPPPSPRRSTPVPQTTTGGLSGCFYCSTNMAWPTGRGLATPHPHPVARARAAWLLFSLLCHFISPCPCYHLSYCSLCLSPPPSSPQAMVNWDPVDQTVLANEQVHV